MPLWRNAPTFERCDTSVLGERERNGRNFVPLRTQHLIGGSGESHNFPVLFYGSAPFVEQHHRLGLFWICAQRFARQAAKPVGGFCHPRCVQNTQIEDQRYGGPNSSCEHLILPDEAALVLRLPPALCYRTPAACRSFLT